MFKRCRTGFVAVLLVLAMTNAFAEPMTFHSVGIGTIVAEGDITDGTPTELRNVLYETNISEIRLHQAIRRTVVLNSRGGDLMARMALGRIIRQERMNTRVEGECDSSCTFVFLGGIDRSVADGARYGVHRFTGTTEANADVMQATQQLAGVLAGYIREMGVSSEMYELMTNNGPDDIQYLAPAVMARLNITTSDRINVRMASEGGTPVLHLEEATSGGGHRFEIGFYCDGARFLARGFFKGQPPASYTLSWRFNGSDTVQIPASAYRDHTYGLLNDKFFVAIVIPPGLFQSKIQGARSIAIDLEGESSMGFGYLDIVSIGAPSNPIADSFSSLAQTVASSCHDT